jgi:hypothetical protein
MGRGRNLVTPRIALQTPLAPIIFILVAQMHYKKCIHIAQILSNAKCKAIEINYKTFTESVCHNARHMDRQIEIALNIHCSKQRRKEMFDQSLFLKTANHCKLSESRL